MKKILSFVLATTTALSLVACGKPAESNSTQPIATPTIDEPASSGSSGVSGNVIVSDVQGNTDVQENTDGIKLTKILVDSPNNIANNGYMEAARSDGVTLYESHYSDYGLADLPTYKDSAGRLSNTFTGHRIYVRPFRNEDERYEHLGDVVVSTPDVTADEAEEPSSDSEQTDTTQAGNTPVEGVRCIISGAEIYDINEINEVIYPQEYSVLRREGTCERLYIFDSKNAYEEAVKNREDGQAILAGNLIPTKPSVIVNGSLAPNLTYSVDDGGEVYISLRELATVINPNTPFDETAEILTVPGIFNYFEYIPTVHALPGTRDYFQIPDSRDTFLYQYRGLPKPWQETFELPQDTNFVMSVKTISRIFGWEFWIGDNVLKVVTDSLDDTNIDNFYWREINTEVESYELSELEPKDELEEGETTGEGPTE